MNLSNYFHLIIVLCLNTVTKLKVFLFLTNNLNAIIPFQETNNNRKVWSLPNINNSIIIILL